MPVAACSDHDSYFERTLAELREAGLFRECVEVQSPQDARVTVDGRDYVCFCSNNYLGLAGDPRIGAAATAAIERYGWGSGASRLVSGTMTPHRELEEALARFKGAEDALVFPTGYMANIGTIAALVGGDDLVIGDQLNHASIIDGCRLSQATYRVYRHCDVDAARRLLQLLRLNRPRGRVLIVTDSVFSMDGDLAPLPALAALAREFGAMLMIDEAHGTGVLGERGRGAAELLGVEDGVHVTVGTLSKALGGIGGFVAGSRPLIELLRNRARSFIYTTALPAPACAAAMAALRIIEAEPERRARVLAVAGRVRGGLRAAGYDTMQSEHHIIPVLVGETGATAEFAGHLRDRGVLAPSIRPPTVPEGQSRVRLSAMATHSDEDIELLLAAAADFRRA